MQIILSDYNCIGQAETILRVLRYQGYTSLAEMTLVHFRDIGLDPSTDIVLDLENLRGTPRLFIPGQTIIR